MNKPEHKVQQALDAWRSASQREPRMDAQERARGALLSSLRTPQPAGTFFLPRRVLAFVVIAASLLLLVPSHPLPITKPPSSPTAAALPANEIALAASYIRQAPGSQHPQQLLKTAATLLSEAHQKLPANHSAPIWKEWDGTQQELVTTEHEIEQEGSPGATPSPVSSDSSPSPSSGITGETPSPSADHGDTGGDSGQGE